MSLDKKFFMVEEACACQNNPTDGYASFNRFRCLRCRDTRVIRTQLSLLDLKALLDGYSG
jgi:hypothetical protein